MTGWREIAMDTDQYDPADYAEPIRGDVDQLIGGLRIGASGLRARAQRIEQDEQPGHPEAERFILWASLMEDAAIRLSDAP